MKTVQVNIYKFNELSEEAKQKAISSLSDINLDCTWWGYIFDDARTVGIKLTSFDLDRRRNCEGEILDSHYSTARSIMDNHGESTDTYQLAAAFVQDYDKLVEKYSDGIDTNVVAEDNEHKFNNKADKLEEEFKRAILKEYSSMLQRGYEYLQSDQAIIDTIEANEYDFTEDGKLY
jgi:hypothetical protein